MPRKRQVDPAFFSDEVMVALPLEAAWLYFGLWFWADDRGNVEDSPRQWRLWVFPGRQYSVEQVSGWRTLLVAERRILPYSANGKNYFHIPTLLLHQSIQHPSKPRCPPPPDTILTEPSLSPQEKGGVVTEPSRIGTRVELSRDEINRVSTPPSSSPRRQHQKVIRVSSLSEDPVFLQELTVKFPQLDIRLELVACDDHWGTRVKAPKKAFINWLQRAAEFRSERSSNGRPGQDRSVPGNRPAGAFSDLEDK